MTILLPLISILAMVIIIVNSVLLYRTAGMGRWVVLVFILTRMNWLIFFALLALGVMSNLEVILFTSILLVLLLFSVEILMMAVTILGEKHAK